MAAINNKLVRLSRGTKPLFRELVRHINNPVKAACGAEQRGWSDELSHDMPQGGVAVLALVQTPVPWHRDWTRSKNRNAREARNRLR